MQREPPPSQTLPTSVEHRGSVMILSAGMGGGHDGAARGLSQLLESIGYRAEIVDLLQMMRFGYGRFISGLYQAQLRFAPWSYQAVYSAWRTRPSLVRSANGVDYRVARRSLLEAIEGLKPDCIISTYNIGSQVIGELARTGSLQVPVFSFVTDFGVHPYWIHEAMDGYLAVHRSSARAIEQVSSAPVQVCGALVGAQFRDNGDGCGDGCPDDGCPDDVASEARRLLRSKLGIGDDDRMALVVAGAWGVGEIDATACDLQAIEGWVPVVVCGSNSRLAGRLSRKVGDARQVMGFTHEMPALMKAAEVLVENAGGMTCFEAFASRLPVITYRPIPGHGLDNASAMASAGVTTFAEGQFELGMALQVLLDDADRRGRQLEAASEVIHDDPAAAVLDLIGSVPTHCGDRR